MARRSEGRVGPVPGRRALGASGPSGAWDPCASLARAGAEARPLVQKAPMSPGRPKAAWLPLPEPAWQLGRLGINPTPRSRWDRVPLGFDRTPPERSEEAVGAWEPPTNRRPPGLAFPPRRGPLRPEQPQTEQASAPLGVGLKQLGDHRRRPGGVWPRGSAAARHPPGRELAGELRLFGIGLAHASLPRGARPLTAAGSSGRAASPHTWPDREASRELMPRP